jgi:glutathione S-transferase
MLRGLKLEFRETLLPLDRSGFKAEVARYGPSGRVPVLLDGELAIWDSLAICEYAAEIAGRGWPKERAARAVARSVCAEMHAGFVELRRQWPMNARARNRHTPMTAGLSADIDRIDAIWADCRRRFGNGGPWLFGEYSAADAMYAPVVLRFNTYGIEALTDISRSYIATALSDSSLQAWITAASAEVWHLPHEEVG